MTSAVLPPTPPMLPEDVRVLRDGAGDIGMALMTNCSACGHGEPTREAPTARNRHVTFVDQCSPLNDDERDPTDKTTRRTHSTEGGKSQRVKSRHSLRLPSFQPLGFRHPFAGALPTPPEEPLSSNLALTLLHPTGFGRSQSFSIENRPPSPNSKENYPFPTRSLSISFPRIPIEPTLTRIDSPTMASFQPTQREVEGPRMLPVIEAVDLAVNQISSQAPHYPPVIRILSQTQPRPLLLSGSPMKTGLNALMDQFEGASESKKHIELTHCVPPDYDLSQIISTPTSTSSNTSNHSHLNIFPRYAVIADYTSSSAGYRAAGPPSSIPISVFERYIPPPTAQEYSELFSPARNSSALIDRLREISPEKGTLILIYPTRQGAQDFKTKYLYPLMDPILRTLIGVENLSSSFGPAITAMESAAYLDDYETLRGKLQTLLTALNAESEAESTADQPRPANFSLKYETRYVTSLPESSALSATGTSNETTTAATTSRNQNSSWLSWYISQEKPRIQRTIAEYYVRGHRVPDERRLSAGTLLWRILDGVVAAEAKGASGASGAGAGAAGVAGNDTSRGVEVGVFVVVRDVVDEEVEE